jgi:hypothetical protein
LGIGVLGPQVFAAWLRRRTRLAKGPPSELVIVDERPEDLLHLRVARRGRRFVQQLSEVPVLRLDEPLRVLGMRLRRERQSERGYG